MDIIHKVVPSKERNGESTVLSEIIDDKSLTWDHPKVIQLATEVISDYGAVIKKTSKMMFGVPESMLPYPKKDIREAIELLLCFLKNKSLWEELREECPKEFPVHTRSNIVSRRAGGGGTFLLK